MEIKLQRIEDSEGWRGGTRCAADEPEKCRLMNNPWSSSSLPKAMDTFTLTIFKHSLTKRHGGIWKRNLKWRITSMFHKFSSVRGRKCFVTHFENSRQALQNLRVEWISYCNVFLPIAIGCFPASVPGPTHSGWHVHESAHGLTAIVAAGPISG